MTRGLLLLFCVGALAMGKAKTQEKKAQEPTEFTFEGTTFTERVTLTRKKPMTKDEFFAPLKDVWVVRKDVPKKGLMFRLAGQTESDGAGGIRLLMRQTAAAGSTLADKDGNVYEVTETEGSDDVLWVKLVKAAPKKKP